jgi:DNA replication protein DnaC
MEMDYCYQGQIMEYLKERDLVEHRRRHLDETLSPDIALRKTAYDDQGKLPCDKDTRVDILADITNWINDVSPRSTNFFWMTGDPGCGKSAIAASLARYCKDGGVLWAQFFINRNNETTTNPRVYFPSIARQMAKHSSGSTVSKAIYDILQARPSLLDGISNDQALELFSTGGSGCVRR